MPATDPSGLAFHHPLDQRVLGLQRLVLADLAGFARGLDVEELRADGALVVVVVLGLLEHALGDPHGAAHGSERKREESADQPHADAPSGVKLYAGSGPIARSEIRSPSSVASVAAAAANASIPSRATRNATLTAPSSPDTLSARLATASGSSRSNTN